MTLSETDSVLSVDPMDIQNRLEEEMRTVAEARLQKDVQSHADMGAFSDSRVGVKFVKAAYKPFVDAVRSFVYPTERKAGRQQRAAGILRDTGLEPEVIAYLFVKGVFNWVFKSLSSDRMKRIKRVSLCINAADLIHTEWRLRVFEQTEGRKALLDKIMRDMDRRTYPKEWRLRTIRMYFDAERVEWNGWTRREKLLVGYSLMLLFRDSTGLIEAPKDDMYVSPTPALVEAIQKAMQASATDFTLYWPMVKKPIPWSEDRNLFRGGYLGKGRVRPYPIIKGATKRDVDRMLKMDWSQVLPAINTLQETPWRVNRKMVEILDWVFNDLGDGRCDLPMPNDIPLPPIPFDYDTNEEVKKAHNSEVFLIHDANRQLISKRIAVISTLALAKKFQQFHKIYFPHNLDSRGRAYPLPAFLNPQGPDYSKSLLEFAHSEPIEDDEQAAWLAIAGANAWGNDKVSLQERADWVVDNEWWIVECGRNPKANTKWMEADEPFMFLRFCMEWAGYVEAYDQGLPFYSRMPIHVDATNSGLQHYSAMLRDPVGGRSVNLVPGLDRQDIYGDVAKETLRILEGLVDDPDVGLMAQGWIAFGLDRKMTKRQVMVVPYAGKFSSCMEYTRDGYLDKLKAGHARLWDKQEDHPRVIFLAKCIWEAIDNVVVKGKEAMQWLSKASSAWSKGMNKAEVEDAYDRRLTWTTPDGFEAVQWRDTSRKCVLNTKLEGRVQLVYYEETGKLDGRDMSLSMAPNFVHSLDACHMRMSIMKAMELGIRHFAMIHDSFGVHARFMPMFIRDAVKPAFIEMYRDNNPLKDLADKIPFKMDPPPVRGSLDLEGIHESEFFFS